jgi:hypothetical protein
LNKTITIWGGVDGLPALCNFRPVLTILFLFHTVFVEKYPSGVGDCCWLRFASNFLKSVTTNFFCGFEVLNGGESIPTGRTGIIFESIWYYRSQFARLAQY